MRSAFVLGWLGSLALTACFNPHPVSGAACDELAMCPQGQMCLAGVCRAPGNVVGDARSDASDASDGAMAPIDQRICSDAGSDEGDEDGDQLADNCDPCPIDIDNSDPDGDGVAGACDPHPAAPGDMIVAFTGFHHGVPADWGADGTIAQDGDSIVITTGAAKAGRVVAPFDRIANGTITASITVDTAAGGTEGAFMNVALPYDRGVDEGIFCQLSVPDTNSSSNHYVSLWDSVLLSERGSVGLAWVFKTPYQVALTRTNVDYACSVTAPGATPKTATGTTSTTHAQSKAAVASYGANAHVHWVLVVSSP